MSDFIKLDYSSIQQTLSSTNHGPLTVLLISDSAFHSLPAETVSDLQLNPDKLTAVITHLTEQLGPIRGFRNWVIGHLYLGTFGALGNIARELVSKQNLFGILGSRELRKTFW